jgi:hypothetical protein
MKLLIFLWAVCITYFLNERHKIPDQKDPVKIFYTVERITKRHVKVDVTFKIDSPWHIFSQNQEKDFIGTKTLIKSDDIVENKKWSWVESGELLTRDDSQIGLIQKYYEKTVTFSNVLELKDQESKQLTLYITTQSCSLDKCLPPKDITVTLNL